MKMLDFFYLFLFFVSFFFLQKCFSKCFDCSKNKNKKSIFYVFVASFAFSFYFYSVFSITQTTMINLGMVSVLYVPFSENDEYAKTYLRIKTKEENSYFLGSSFGQYHISCFDYCHVLFLK